MSDFSPLMVGEFTNIFSINLHFAYIFATDSKIRCSMVLFPRPDAPRMMWCFVVSIPESQFQMVPGLCGSGIPSGSTYESESSMGLYLLEWIAFIRPLHFDNWYSLLVGDMHSLLAIRIPKLRVAMLATIGVVVLQFFWPLS